MMVPGQPASNLVMIHPGCCFGILEGSFDKISLPLHVGESFGGSLCRGVGQAVLDGFWGINLAPDHKMPLSDGLFVVKPNKDALREYIHLQLSFGGITNGYPLPGIFWLTGGPLLRDHPRTFGRVQGGSSAFGRLSFWDIWSRIFEIKRLILVNIGNKLFALVIKGLEQVRILAIASVKTDPGPSHPQCSYMVNDIEHQLRFGLEDDVFRDTCCLAALAIIGPLLGQIQATGDDRCRYALHQRRIHAGLAVIDLAETAAPLASNADRLLPFFGIGAFVENKGAVSGAP